MLRMRAACTPASAQNVRGKGVCCRIELEHSTMVLFAGSNTVFIFGAYRGE